MVRCARRRAVATERSLNLKFPERPLAPHFAALLAGIVSLRRTPSSRANFHQRWQAPGAIAAALKVVQISIRWRLRRS